MKDSVIVLCLIFIALVAYCERDKLFPPPPPQIVYLPAPTPTPKPTPTRHLAPEGMFYMVEYVAARTPHGITGFVPGQGVKFVSANEAKGTLVVSNGDAQVEVGPMQITNDLDIAAIAKRQDQQSQQLLQSSQEAAWKMDEQVRRQIDMDHARSVAAVRSGAAIGGRNSALDGGSQAASSFDRFREENYGVYGSPYYYLHRGYYSGGLQGNYGSQY